MKLTRTVLITGCSSGIGLAAARGLGEAGFEVIAACRTEDQAQNLRSAGMKAVVMDNTCPDSIGSGWDAAKSLAGGSIWGVFANAGYGQPGALEDITWEAMHLQMTTNVMGTQELLRLAIGDMREWGGGRLIVCSSVLGVVAMRGRGAYVASKFALEGMVDTYRLELEGSGIGIALLEPGPVFTRFRANGHRMLKRFVDTERSAHKAMYERLEPRLLKEGPIVPFTGKAEDCVPMLIHALTSRRPKARYKWTVQTKVFTTLKRLLPVGWMDAIARRG